MAAISIAEVGDLPPYENWLTPRTFRFDPLARKAPGPDASKDDLSKARFSLPRHVFEGTNLGMNARPSVVPILWWLPSIVTLTELLKRDLQSILCCGKLTELPRGIRKEPPTTAPALREARTNRPLIVRRRIGQNAWVISM
jgi:hypothetical protein